METPNAPSAELAAAIAALVAAVQPAPGPTAPVTLLTVEEAAKRLRCGRTLVYDLLRDGRLPAVRVGRRRLVKVTDVDKFVAGGGCR